MDSRLGKIIRHEGTNLTLYAIGLGLNAEAYLTNEARRVIKSCTVLYALSPDAEDLSLLKRLNPNAKLVDCRRFYETKRDRPAVYNAIAEALITDCSLFSDTGLVVYGHPMFLVSAVEKALEKARAASIPTKVIPGISSFDVILADLQVDLGYGVTLLDATLLVQNKIRPDKSIPALVFQIANVCSTAVEREFIPRTRLGRLLRVLKEHYPANHPCKIVVSQNSIYDRGYVVDETLETLMLSEKLNLTDRPTLFLPPVCG